VSKKASEIYAHSYHLCARIRIAQFLASENRPESAIYINMSETVKTFQHFCAAHTLTFTLRLALRQARARVSGRYGCARDAVSRHDLSQSGDADGAELFAGHVFTLLVRSLSLNNSKLVVIPSRAVWP
jgi:hypothetical protein